MKSSGPALVSADEAFISVSAILAEMRKSDRLKESMLSVELVLPQQQDLQLDLQLPLLQFLIRKEISLFLEVSQVRQASQTNLMKASVCYRSRRAVIFGESAEGERLRHGMRLNHQLGLMNIQLSGQ